MHKVFGDLHYVIHVVKMFSKEWEDSQKIYHHLFQAIINLSWDLAAKGIQTRLARSNGA